jgi:NADP-dependent 3-hydroxy acid dehydrogenase YdfG
VRSAWSLWDRRPELAFRARQEVREGIAQITQIIELLRPDDVAAIATYIVTRDRRVAVNEILISAGDQNW